jgi:hypothetical protein
MTRMFSVAVVFAVAGAAAVVACGGNSSSSSGTDAKVFLDGQGSGSGSGSGSGDVLGRHCTPSGSASGSDAFPQGDCPSGYECLQLTGGNDTWCSRKCTMGSADTCNQGYSGTGEGQCVWNVGFGSGSDSPHASYCGIVCALTINGSNACSNCNGTCPGALTCSASLQFSGSGSNSGSACL